MSFIGLKTNAKVIYPFFMKWASLNKKGIDYLSIRLVRARSNRVYTVLSLVKINKIAYFLGKEYITEK